MALIRLTRLSIICMDCNITRVKLTLTNEDGKGKGLPIVYHEDTEGSTGKNVRILNVGVRLGWVVTSTPRPLYRNKTAAPMYQTLGATQVRCEGVCRSEYPFL
jgi:hypothetical protein